MHWDIATQLLSNPLIVVSISKAVSARVGRYLGPLSSGEDGNAVCFGPVLNGTSRTRCPCSNLHAATRSGANRREAGWVMAVSGAAINVESGIERRSNHDARVGLRLARDRLATSIARPGGNITGIAMLATEQNNAIDELGRLGSIVASSDYSWRTALCSRKCSDQFKARQAEDADFCYLGFPTA